MRKILGIVGAGLLASISGNAIWVLSLINLVWMLFKDIQLFSWWWVGGSIIVFVSSLVVVFVSMFLLKD